MADLPFGRDDPRRQHLGRLLRTVTLYGFCSLLVAAGAVAGLIPAWACAVQLGYNAVGWLGFYVLIRSGVSQRFRDPSLAFAQLLFGLSTVVLSYGLIDIARGAALQLLCLMLALNMGRLSSQRLLWTSVLAVALLALTSVGRWWVAPEAVQIGSEIYDLLMAAVLLPVAIVVGSKVRRLYRLQVSQREALAHALTQLSELSRRDALTGLINRRQMSALLADEHKRLRRLRRPACVAILDIDWFKRINDAHGHGVGDAVLRQFGQLAGAVIEPVDTLARWGGEEFLLLMPTSDETQALRTVARIRAAIVAHDWAVHDPDGAGLQVRFSAGLSAHDPALPIEQTLEQADQALYRAKNDGRDRTVAWRPAHAGAQPHPAADTQALVPRRTALPVADADAHAAATAAPPAAGADGSAPGPTAGPARRALQGLTNLLLGADPQLRERLWLSSIAMALYGVWIAMFAFYAIPSGLMDPVIGRVLIGYDLVVVTSFYLLIRTGVSARWRDAELMLPQVVAATGACVVCYAAAPVLRPSVLHLLCVVQVFGMGKLRPTENRIAGFSVVAMLLVMLATMSWLAPAGFVAPDEALKLALACFVLSRLSALSHSYSQVRERVAAEQQQLASAVAQVQELVIRDALTGLFNRKGMQDLLAREHERSLLTGSRFCVALIDLDHFKRINDTLGHQRGDEVLIGFAKAAVDSLRDTDVICRWGGEEFLVLMRDTAPAAQGLRALARLRENVAALRLVPGASDLSVTFSCGITAAQPQEPLEPVIARADRALYAAKAAGRNRTLVANDSSYGPVHEETEPYAAIA